MPAFARQHLDDVQTKTAAHEPRQHSDVGLAEHLARELGRAVFRSQPAELAAVFARSGSSTVARPPPGSLIGFAARLRAAGRSGRSSARLRSASTSTPGVTANSTWRRRTRSPTAKRGGIGRVEAPARRVVGHRVHEFAVEQRLDGVGRGFADRAARRRGVVLGEQSCARSPPGAATRRSRGCAVRRPKAPRRWRPAGCRRRPVSAQASTSPRRTSRQPTREVLARGHVQAP